MKQLQYLLLLALFSSCLTDINQIKELTINDDAPFEVMQDVELFYSDSSVLKVKLLATTIQRFSGDRNEIVFPKGIDVTFFSNGTHIQSTLTANYAVKHINTDITEVKENVILKNNKGEKLNTEHLIWDENNALLKSDKDVTITTATEIIKGNGFEADQEFEHYKINNITGTITLNEDEKIH